MSESVISLLCGFAGIVLGVILLLGGTQFFIGFKKFLARRKHQQIRRWKR